MFMSLKTSIVEMIEQSSWPDPITKRKALSKARSLKSNLVTSPIFFNETFLEEMAASVSIYIKHISCTDSLQHFSSFVH